MKGTGEIQGIAEVVLHRDDADDLDVFVHWRRDWQGGWTLNVVEVTDEDGVVLDLTDEEHARVTNEALDVAADQIDRRLARA